MARVGLWATSTWVFCLVVGRFGLSSSITYAITRFGCVSSKFGRWLERRYATTSILLRRDEATAKTSSSSPKKGVARPPARTACLGGPRDDNPTMSRIHWRMIQAMKRPSMTTGPRLT